MARAGRVRGIKPRKSLKRNARLVVTTRLEELLSWSPALRDPLQVTDLHNMRIAAKRLRYALEIFAVCFDTRDALKALTAMQEDLGTIHDLDVLVDILRERLRLLNETVEHEALTVAARPGTAEEREARLTALLADESVIRRQAGLFGLLADKREERAARFTAFAAQWDDEALERFRAAVLETIGASGR